MSSPGEAYSQTHGSKKPRPPGSLGRRGIRLQAPARQLMRGATTRHTMRGEGCNTQEEESERDYRK